jgi:hypothetical protein
VSEQPLAPGPPDRSIRLVRSPHRDGVGVFQIRAGGRLCFYTFHEIPCDIGGRGFAVHRLGVGELYHVRIGRRADCSCDCKGFVYRDHCCHVLGLLALARAGKLSRAARRGDPAALDGPGGAG